MKFFDILRLALRNLREARLRAGLTTLGVIVGVSMIVTMMSFGLGLQRNAVQRFRDLDLFNEINVSGRDLMDLVSSAMEGGAGERGSGERRRGGPDGGRVPDKPPERVLNDAALAEIGGIAGVAAVEPNVTLSAYVRANKRAQLRQVGGALVPNAATRFKTFLAGRMISSPEADEAVVDEFFLRNFGYEKAQDAIGQTLELLAPGGATAGDESSNEGRASSGRKDTETKSGAGDDGDKNGASENGDAGEDAPLSFFGLPLEGEMPEDDPESALAARTFRIVGVLQTELEGSAQGRSRFRGLMPVSSIYIPLDAARAWSKRYRNSLSEVAFRLARESGMIKEDEAEGYQMAVVRVSDPDALPNVQKRLNELGFSSFSVVDQLKELRTVFLILNSALGLLGGISLLVASFGIANTMIMSILERTREIGIMKAIGAEDREIKLIFFVEAGLIGMAGGVLGSLAAWAIAAVANRVAYRFILKPQGVAYVDFFALPPYLWLGAILFAVAVAILAALYPAARAARIDPVKALRHD
ncbi:MAG TPA: FtsX-like permease family protein [Pyrinomonadaceae bacterium]|jgi:ABC-type lipoprotein release transport system permease subunit|nr:FtsX-like permease family protein [Pyrinomonadaceae bacterium]